jgi:oxaloacetate decarboxylase (Na+ extruding) subunit alpha
MKVNITETVLRDAQQSLIATRMKFEDFSDILENLDKAGFYSLEAWGGATFDSCLRYLNEDPWERLRRIKETVKNTKLQMLLRGQNLLGYKHYPDDIVREFIKHSIINGIDIIRIFDALNDFRNIKVAVDETLKQGAHAQGAIAYTISPIHSIKNYVKLGKELEAMGVSSICVKDMAGIMGPKDAYELVKALKQVVKIPIFVHTHSTTGLGPLAYLKAIEAGADGIDTAISSLSGGTSQPATETLHFALKELGYDTGLDEKLLKEINDHFKPIKERFIASGQLNPFVLSTDTDALTYQVPGGMLSNMISQLKQQNALHRLDEVLAEIPKVRKDLGYPPLVTPMSQMVGTQSATNILVGERYKMILKEVKSYIKGEYGKAPGKVNESLIKKVLGDEKPLEIRFADTLEPMFDKTREEVKDFAKTDEDVLSYILFPQIAEDFLKKRIKKDDEPMLSSANENSEKIIEYSIETV